MHTDTDPSCIYHFCTYFFCGLVYPTARRSPAGGCASQVLHSGSPPASEYQVRDGRRDTRHVWGGPPKNGTYWDTSRVKKM